MRKKTLKFFTSQHGFLLYCLILKRYMIYLFEK